MGNKCLDIKCATAHMEKYVKGLERLLAISEVALKLLKAGKAQSAENVLLLLDKERASLDSDLERADG